MMPSLVVAVTGLFTEVNPDKGTETPLFFVLGEHFCFTRFTEVNPDKGTETSNILRHLSPIHCLQKLTPIRGRKLEERWEDSFLRYRLQKLTPIRGRKLEYLIHYKCLLCIVYRS